MTNENVINRLQTRPTFWGKTPPSPPEPPEQLEQNDSVSVIKDNTSLNEINIGPE